MVTKRCSLTSDRRHFPLEQDCATTALAQENELLNNTEKDLNELLLEKQQLRNRIVVALGIMVGISAVLLMVRLENNSKNERCTASSIYHV
ncbi:hypothetical protein OK016_17800 [Vibrio chagasii]|nr:hypothetical protein [Vibrio chagasii]